MTNKYYKYWKKDRTEEQEKIRQKAGAYSYDCTHVNGIKAVKACNEDIKNNITKISCPILSIHSIYDGVGHQKSAIEINEEVNSQVKKLTILKEKTHNVFYSESTPKVYRAIIDFIEENNLFKDKNRN